MIERSAIGRAVLFASATAVFVLSGCAGQFLSGGLSPGESDSIHVGDEIWVRSAPGGYGFSFVYKLPGDDTQILVTSYSRAEQSPASGQEEIMRDTLRSWRRHFDRDLDFQGSGSIETDFGELLVFEVLSTDPTWNLRFLAAYSDSRGRISQVAFIGSGRERLRVLLGSYLERMWEAGLLNEPARTALFTAPPSR